MSHGATLEQIEPIENLMRALSTTLESQGLIRGPQKYAGIYQWLSDKVANDLGLDSGLVATQLVNLGRRAETTRFLFQNNLGREDPQRNFIGFNNPNLKQLGITDYAELQKHLKTRKRNARFS
jgi:hypothetical protein